MTIEVLRLKGETNQAIDSNIPYRRMVAKECKPNNAYRSNFLASRGLRIPNDFVCLGNAANCKSQ